MRWTVVLRKRGCSSAHWNIRKKFPFALGGAVWLLGMGGAVWLSRWRGSGQPAIRPPAIRPPFPPPPAEAVAAALRGAAAGGWRSGGWLAARCRVYICNQRGLHL